MTSLDTSLYRLFAFFILSIALSGLSCAERIRYNLASPSIAWMKPKAGRLLSAMRGRLNRRSWRKVRSSTKERGPVRSIMGSTAKATVLRRICSALTPPRDFTGCQFQKARDDGELFWIIKNGIPGTGMVRMIPSKLAEEEGWKLVAYIRILCKAQ